MQECTVTSLKFVLFMENRMFKKFVLLVTAATVFVALNNQASAAYQVNQEIDDPTQSGVKIQMTLKYDDVTRKVSYKLVKKGNGNFFKRKKTVELFKNQDVRDPRTYFKCNSTDFDKLYPNIDALIKQLPQSAFDTPNAA